MSYETWASIAATPWWVFAGFFYLIWLGIAATSPRIVSFKGLMVLPAIFLFLSLVALLSIVKITLTNFFIWQAAVLVGLSIGLLQCWIFKMKALKNQKAFYIPGTYSLLILLAIIFSAKYFWNFDIVLSPQFLMQASNAPILISLYGISLGLFAGQFFYALRCLRHGPFMEPNFPA